VWLGLVLSYHLGTAASATMAIIPVGLFFLVLPISKWVNSRRQARENATDSVGAGEVAA